MSERLTVGTKIIVTDNQLWGELAGRGRIVDAFHSFPVGSVGEIIAHKQTTYDLAECDLYAVMVDGIDYEQILAHGIHFDVMPAETGEK